MNGVFSNGPEAFHIAMPASPKQKRKGGRDEFILA
jgi:hypothetical protein